MVQASIVLTVLMLTGNVPCLCRADAKAPDTPCVRELLRLLGVTCYGKTP